VVAGVSAGIAWQRLATHEGEVGSGEPVTNTRVLDGIAQELSSTARLLAAARSLDPFACRLVAESLENRWGLGPAMPGWGLPGDGGRDVTVAVQAARQGDVAAGEVHPLIKALGSGDPCERRVAAVVIGRAPKDDALAPLLDLLDASTEGARVGAAMALGYGEWTEGIGPLSGALANGRDDLRITAAWALGRTEADDAIGVLSRALDDAQVDVRINAALALGQIENSDAIPALTALLASDSDPLVRRAAAWALGRIE